MKLQASILRYAASAAMLCGGLTVPAAGWTHWEGFEAADPSTPAALLRFESAAADYVEADVIPVSWLKLFDDGGRLGDEDSRNISHDESGSGGPAGSNATEPVTGIPVDRAQPAPQTGAHRG
ncbi:MAG: hypothetical protein OXF98_08150 [Rhodospirillaceae bacterium]|nr:hypothetical protein [Rhodospirillaceae bacterium]